MRFRTALLACLASIAPLVAGHSSSADTPPASHLPRYCKQRGAIPAHALAGGLLTRSCPLTGRVVVSGETAVLVPPPGTGVGSAAAAASPGGAPTELRVTNANGVVTASTSGQSGLASMVSPAACRDRTYVLEFGGHPWASKLRWRYQARSTPERMRRAAAVRQIRLGNRNVVTGRNDCGRSGVPKAASRYDGATRRPPNVFVRGGVVGCGRCNTRNSVGWGPLPGNLLGYTCYWWNARGNMIAADMRLDPAPRTVLRYPHDCEFRFDLQSLTTHEWGHAFGLDHPGPGHAKLTMAPLLPACSTSPRTLGLGDWRGLRALYGLR